ncbi:transposable element Tcb1 transposase [Trichonephila clavipes]|nr:transposable element Tcb1 transposase [Trichonephila clavipes]
MRICDRWMQEGTTDRCGRSHPPQCTTSREDSACAYHSTQFTAEWSVRKTSIAWSTLDAEPQSSPPLMYAIAGTLNYQHYISEVLEPVVLPYLQGLATAIFQQDNARPHGARIVQRFFVNHQIELLHWPARSPDLSSIEMDGPWLLND